ncbi:MAG: hypothetical protein ACU0DK_05410 [Pseudooceanicola sp.]
MADRQRILFLERRTYRRRRLADLSRLMPLIGLVLLMVPLMWTSGEGGIATSRSIEWVFGVWVMLILVGAWLSSRRLDSELDGQSAPRPIAGESGQDPG